MKHEWDFPITSFNFKRISLNNAIAAAGVLFAVLGSAGLFRTISSPFNPVGAFVYFITGSVIALTYSRNLRYMLVQNFSRETLSLLYEKSLIDLFLEPSPYLKAYTLLALAVILDPADVSELSHALPPACHIFRERGLVRFLPRPLQNLLRADFSIARTDDAQPTSDRSVYSELEVIENVFVAPPSRSISIEMMRPDLSNAHSLDSDVLNPQVSSISELTPFNSTARDNRVPEASLHLSNQTEVYTIRDRNASPAQQRMAEANFDRILYRVGSRKVERFVQIHVMCSSPTPLHKINNYLISVCLDISY